MSLSRSPLTRLPQYGSEQSRGVKCGFVGDPPVCSQRPAPAPEGSQIVTAGGQGGETAPT